MKNCPGNEHFPRSPFQYSVRNNKEVLKVNKLYDDDDDNDTHLNFISPHLFIPLL